MPLSEASFTLNGGCNCGAVRYRIAVPPLADRPVHYSYPAAAASDPATPRLPVSVTDHCNSCRSATASILPAWLLVPRAMVTISCLPRTRQPEPSSLVFATDAGIPRLPLATDAARVGEETARQ